MQFRVRDREAIASGRITTTFRRWRSPQARVGGRYRLGTIVIEVTAVEQISPSDISAGDARAAGHDSPEAVLEAIRRNQRKGADANAPLYRVDFKCLGEQPDPRSILAAEAGLDSGELTTITGRLAKMDSRARHGPWTRTTLEAISATPGRRAAELAVAQGRETQKFKTDVRKLKALGLTISLEVGYELSPRGRVVLDALQSESSDD